MSKIIEIIVSPTGQTQVKTKGFTGNECRDASRFIEESLEKCTSEKLTNEFHQRTSQQADQQVEQ